MRRKRYRKARDAKQRRLQALASLKLQKEKIDLKWLHSFTAQELEDYERFFASVTAPHAQIKIRRILKEKERLRYE